MAACCITVCVSAPGALAKELGHGVGLRQAAAGGRVALTTPSVSRGAAAAAKSALLALSTSGARRGRNAAIAARAADLEQGLEDVVEDFMVGDEDPSGQAPPASSSPPPSPQAGTKLYVGNLPWSVHSKQLAEIFQDVGNVELVEVIYDRESQKSRGFAFVTMASVEDAQRAIEMLHESDVEGRMIKVNFPAARDGPRREGGFRSEGGGGFRSERPPRRDYGAGGGGGGGGGSYGTENKLFVGNLSWAVDDVSLDSLFKEYGKVVKAEVVYDRQTGRSRGFGFVTLSSPGEVNHAISNLDGKEFDKRMLRVNLAGDKPPPREPRMF